MVEKSVEHKVENDFQQLANNLNEVMGADKHRLSTRLQQMRRRATDGKAFDESLTKWLAEVERSTARVISRKEAVPSIEFPEDLPISAKRELIAETIAKHLSLIHI